MEDRCISNLYSQSPTFSLKPKYAPTKVSGTEIPNHIARIATKVPKGMAAEDPFTHRMRFIMKKSAKTILKKRSEKVLKYSGKNKYQLVLKNKTNYTCTKQTNKNNNQNTTTQPTTHKPVKSLHQKKM